jgi:xanthine dehydrogenase accessory factor
MAEILAAKNGASLPKAFSIARAKAQQGLAQSH